MHVYIYKHIVDTDYTRTMLKIITKCMYIEIIYE